MSQQLSITLDRSSPVPAYRQIAGAVQAAIDGGTLAPGELLESEVSLSARLGVSRATTRQALGELVQRGRLVRRRATGTHVTPAAIHRPASLGAVFADMDADERVRVVATEHARVPASADVAQALRVPQSATVLRVRRLRLVDGRPTALLTSYLPEPLAPGPDELERLGLDGYLRAHGVVARTAAQRIGARAATADEADALGELPGASLLALERTTFDDAGRAVEFAHELYRGMHTLRALVSTA
ncbi:GntR family transcriptional regulator [Actinotalea sp. M2MS4P-6]|uniref:GntR family transcriptional regulator n=1 Tax=Actinotalea sp. M2MS4P-6 TaxID=2983762 RepID=UPI0021E3A1B6|nr:GntR family transcriptional regulator [Actinotalea sp. M2MS4P-6]MCV2395402.1 GntR family transcriptional regulator [Actinotalea sp. M2MS4P-6]